MAFTSDVIAKISQATVDGSVPVLVDIQHDRLIWSDNSEDNGHLRLIGDVKGVVYKGKHYYPVSLSYTPPSNDGKSVSGAQLKISALNTNAIKVIKKIDEPFYITAIASFLKDGTKVYFKALTNITSEVSTASWDKSVATFPLTFDKTEDLVCPRDTATKQRLPALNTGTNE